MLKLIRTTYWTRKMNGKRPDEDEDFTKLHDTDTFKIPLTDSDFELEELKSKDADVQIKSSKGGNRVKKIFNSFLSVFCGYEDMQKRSGNEIKEEKECESKRRFESFYSLNQTRFERTILNINLVIILLVAISLYIFFSVPVEYHIFKHVKLNRTSFSLD